MAEPESDDIGVLSRVTPSRVVDEVVRQLKGLLSDGRVRPGARLPSERRLAEEFGVGRPAVREALRELRAEGLVVTGRGRQGTVVAPRETASEETDHPAARPARRTPSASPYPTSAPPADSLVATGSITQLLELRAAVETQAAALAVRRGDAADLESIAGSLPDAGHLDAQRDRQFHEGIAAAAHNPMLQEAVCDLVERLHQQAATHLDALYEQPHRAAIGGQHAAILAAIRSGDEEGARRSMARHLDYVSRVLGRLVGARRSISMLVCDLDGTLLAGPRLITERTRQALAAAKEEQIAVVLASARPPRSMRVYHLLLGLNTPIIAGNGALLWNLESSIPLARESIDHGLARDIVESGRSLGAIVNIESDDEWFSEQMNERIARNLKVYGLEPPHRVGPVDDLLDEGEPIDKVFLDLRDLDQPAQEKARAVIAASFAERTNVTETAEGLVDLVSRRASKAVMAQRLARARGIGADQVAAVGDHDNDVALLRWAGTGIAMGNATLAAKKAADLVTSSNLRDGVAEAIYNWVLSR